MLIKKRARYFLFHQQIQVFWFESTLSNKYFETGVSKRTFWKVDFSRPGNHLDNLNVKNTNERVTLLVNLQAEVLLIHGYFWRFANCTYGTKSLKASQTNTCVLSIIFLVKTFRHHLCIFCSKKIQKPFFRWFLFYKYLVII